MKNRYRILLGVLVITGIVGLYASQVSAATTIGPNLPTSAVDAGNGDGWANPTNIENDNLNYAVGSSFTSGFGDTGNLKATGYGFSIPTSATILGVVYTIKRQTKSNTTSPFGDQTISLIKGGVISGNNKAAIGNWSTATTTVSYGSSSDLWGLTLTPTDVNASNFGADFSGEQNAGTGTTGNVYYIKLSVTYSLGSAKVTISKSRVIIGKSKVVIQ